MPTYKSIFRFKRRNGREIMDKASFFRAANDREAIKKVERKIKQIGKRKIDLNNSLVQRGRIYRKTKIVREITFKSTKMILSNLNYKSDKT